MFRCGSGVGRVRAHVKPISRPFDCSIRLARASRKLALTPSLIALSNALTPSPAAQARQHYATHRGQSPNGVLPDARKVHHRNQTNSDRSLGSSTGGTGASNATTKLPCSV